LATALFNCADIALNAAFADSTRGAAKSALKSWRYYCNVVGINPTCSSFSGPDLIPWPLASLQNFFASYICYEVVVRHMHPDSISKNYLGKVVNYLELNGFNPNAAAARSSRQIKLIFKGLKKAYHLIHPAIEGRKIAFTLNMVEQFDHIWQQLGISCPLQRCASKLAAKLGIYFIMRRSEFLPNSSSNRGAQWKHLIFHNQDGYIIKNDDLQQGQAFSVTNHIPFSKSDPHGRGRVVTHYRQPDGQNCIVQDLENYVLFTRNSLRARKQKYVFEVDGVRYTDARLLSSILKCTARYIGISDKSISLHSLRYGGATLLASASLPQYIIEHCGGWARDSGSLKIYVQLEKESAQAVSRAMSIASHLGLADVRVRSTFLGRR
jgi:hypothetical protein